MEILNAAWNWIKANILISVVILIAVVLVFFPKMLKGLFGAPRLRRRRVAASRPAIRRRRTLPRSVGMRKSKPAYHKSGKVKKPWQIKGSEAARRHMRKIRSMR